MLCVCVCCFFFCCFFLFQAEDGIRDLVRSRGLGDVYKRQVVGRLLRDEACPSAHLAHMQRFHHLPRGVGGRANVAHLAVAH